MDFKDYYAALGVPPDADDKTIKNAFRTLARQVHPDVNPGDQAAEERFKEINEAYQALGDPEKRRKYDALREEYRRVQAHGGSRGQAAAAGGGFDWSAWQAAPGEYAATQNVSADDLEDLFGDASPFSDFFSSIYGQPRSARPPRPRRGRDLEVPVELTLEEVFHGTRRTLDVGDRRIEARIPPGVRPGSRVRLAGQGGQGTAGGPAGDIYLDVEVAAHAQFEREDDDLRVTVPVDLLTAAVGGEARVPTLTGRVLLKIPPRTQADTTFRLRGKGMPRLEQPEERGDLYARAKLVLPESLSDAELDTLRSLKDARSRH